MMQKNFWLRMLPVLIIVVVTVVMSRSIYTNMTEREEEICWDRLEKATESTSEKISTRLNDNLKYLTSVANAYTLTHNIADVEAVGRYLDSVVDATLFERVDIILPDESVITQEGEIVERQGKSTYEQLVKKGTHITSRIRSSFTGEEAICCVTPIADGVEVIGLLVGTINCSTLSDVFEVFTYKGESQLFVIDRTNGKYLMDNWHSELGSIYDIGLRQSADSDEMVNMVPAIINGERERLAFISKTNGETSYQFCAPVEGFDWTVCVVVQEDVVFSNLKDLERDLVYAGLLEGFVILIYVVWNVFLNILAGKNEERVKQLEYESAKNEGRAAFISNMSHDIRTPLNGIVGMLQIIRNHRGEAAVVDECLNKIEISARYLSTLTSDMLDINEIENGKLVLDEEHIDLHRLLGELTTLMERQAGEVEVDCSFDSAGLENPYILGSSVHIKRILVNLISNAIKYSKNVGKRVWVTVSDDEISTQPDKRLYRFVIKDNGIGMSEEFQKNMYKAFEQEIIDARSEYQGYGLGLTIVSHLIKKMEGTIELESVKGEGSTFTVTIPFRVDTDEKRHECCTACVCGGNAPADITGMHLLLVEDNEFNMEIANVLLTDAGAVVDMAENGKVAADSFAASEPGSYDAIIMDVMMPVMDGCEAASAIRAMDRPDAQTVPIIAMTASTFSEDVARCIEAGMNTHLPKPLDAGQLIAVIAGLSCSEGEVKRR